ncbi:MAG: phosphate ABC transporter ATP-binding protein PstB [Promethearchaeia archaeon]
MDLKILSKNLNENNKNEGNIKMSVEKKTRDGAIQEKKQEELILECNDLDLWYDDFQALKDINMPIKKNKVTAIIGPSGCGKSTLIRCLNRMNDVIDSCKIEGKVTFHGKNIYNKNINVMNVRTQIGMIFQKPNPFPMSIYDNLAYGPKLHGTKKKEKLDEIVEKSLKRAVIWEEVKDRLDQSALGLSGGQQQRICIARALSIEPEVLLMDEPTSSLDPIATSKIEDLIFELKKKYTVVIVTHNMQQAARISDFTGFMYLGELIEYGKTIQIFEKPKKQLTENYITGRFG